MLAGLAVQQVFRLAGQPLGQCAKGIYLDLVVACFDMRQVLLTNTDQFS